MPDQQLPETDPCIDLAAEPERASLRRADRNFQALLEKSGDAIVLLGEEGTFVYASPAAAGLLGHMVEELVGRNVFEEAHPDDVPQLRKVFRQLLQNPNARVTAQHRCRHRNGSWRWIEVTCTNLLTEPGVQGIAGHCRDITEQQRAEEEAARAAQKDETLALLETLLAIAPIGLALVDREFRFVRVNDATADMDGVPAAQHLGQSVQAVVPQLWPVLEPFLSRVMDKGEPIVGVEVTGETQKGQGQRHWLASFYPIRTGDNQVRGIGVAVLDVTDRRDLERQLRQRAEDLAEAGRRKDQFLDLLGHELRNPLAPIRNALHVLRLRGDDPATVTWVREVAERQVGHLSRLVDDLLDVSSINRGKFGLQRQRLDLAQLVRTTTDDHRGSVEGAGLRLALEVPDRPVWVMGDTTRLSQVLGNLLHNAVKFTDAGGEVTVELVLELNGRRAAVTVRDSGIGIEPELVPHVFETFAQGNRGLDRNRGGLGLGLALVKGLVELQGGQVRAFSAGPGRGAEFTFWLPVERRAVPREVQPTGVGPAGEHLRILVIEDNRDSADSIRVLLELTGHEVQVAHSGPAGVEAARRWQPDVVLCDLGLPGLDGYGVAHALRQDPATAKVRLITMSGYGSEADRRRGRQAGFEVHLTKPVDPERLQQVLLSGGPGS